MKSFLINLLMIGISLGLAACANQPRGAVVPVQGGAKQSVVKAADKEGAFKAFDADAKLTCEKGGALTTLSPNGKYSIISQTSNEKPGEKVKSDSKNLDAGIAVGLKYFGLESKDSYELTTIFRCE